MKLLKCEIRYDAATKLWVFTDPVSGETVTSAGRLKADFIRFVAKGLKDYVANQGLAFSLNIRDRKGRYTDERTYPRSADPSDSAG